MNNKKNIIVSLLVLLIGVTGIFTYNKIMQSKEVEGTKKIIVTVINDGQNYIKEHSHKTDAKNLGEALKEMEIAEVESGQYGNFLVSADGFKADESKQEWWKIVVNGKEAETGMDTIMINDGDKFELVLTLGW